MTKYGEHREPLEPERELLVQQLVSVEQLHVNVSQAVIVTTEDKLELCLGKHLKHAEKRFGWIGPGGICLSIIIALVTTDFKDLVLDSRTWEAVFVLIGIAAFIWFIWSVHAARKSVAVKDIIREIKVRPDQESS